MDVYINPDRLTKLSKNTSIDKQTITSQTFYGSCDYFYNQTGKTPQVKWVLPLGAKAKGFHFGIQFCPCCLNEDGKQPYFRKAWRLGFMTCCLFHSVQLHDRCPKCQSPIDLKRLQRRKDELLFQPEDIVHCSQCGFDLREAQYTETTSEEYEINRINFIQATQGAGKIENLSFCYSNLYFEGVRRLLSLIVCNPKGEKLFFSLRKKLNLKSIYHRELIGHNSEPERLPIRLRRTGFIMIHELLKDWPTTFVKTCKENRISTHMIKTPYLEFPYWVTDAFFFHIHERRFNL